MEEELQLEHGYVVGEVWYGGEVVERGTVYADELIEDGAVLRAGAPEYKIEDLSCTRT